MILYFKTSRSADRFGETDLLLDEDISLGGSIDTYACAGGRTCKAVVSLRPGSASVTLGDGDEVCPVLAIATDRYTPAFVERFCDERTRDAFLETDGRPDFIRLILAHTLDRLADILGLDDTEDVVDRHFHPERFRPAAPAVMTPAWEREGEEDDDPRLLATDDCEVDFGALCEVNLAGHLTVEAKDAAQAAQTALTRVEENLDEEICTDGVLMLTCDAADVTGVDDLGGGRFEVSLRVLCSTELCVPGVDDEDARGRAADILDFETEGLCVDVGGVTLRPESTSVTDIEWM